MATILVHVACGLQLVCVLAAILLSAPASARRNDDINEDNVDNFNFKYLCDEVVRPDGADSGHRTKSATPLTTTRRSRAQRSRVLYRNDDEEQDSNFISTAVAAVDRSSFAGENSAVDAADSVEFQVNTMRNANTETLIRVMKLRNTQHQAPKTRPKTAPVRIRRRS
jgi:hypothetical protein